MPIPWLLTLPLKQSNWAIPRNWGGIVLVLFKNKKTNKKQTFFGNLESVTFHVTNLLLLYGFCMGP